MLAQIPFELSKVPRDQVDREVLRVGMIAELDAVSLYEQLAAMTTRDDLKKVFADIAKEEKTHIGEFQALLLRLDEEQKAELAAGEKEVQELIQ